MTPTEWIKKNLATKKYCLQMDFEAFKNSIGDFDVVNIKDGITGCCSKITIIP